MNERMKTDGEKERDLWLRFLSPGVDLRAGPDTLQASLTGVDWDAPDVSFRLKVCDEFSLLVTIIEGHTLELIRGQESPVLLGTMDPHQMSDALRWAEYEALVAGPAQAATSSYPPWTWELLLGQYVAPTGDCIDALVAAQRGALVASGLFSEAEARAISGYSREIQRTDFQWYPTENRGWLAKGSDSYSLRSGEARTFPFELLVAFFARVGV